MYYFFFFFFKQKTAYEMVMSDWSSDVCSSDLGRVDLVVAGEWMPITIFHNAGGGRLVRQNTPGLEQSNGWWNRIMAGDFRSHGGGRVDFVVGNLGLNTRFQATATEPVTMY